MDQHTLVVCGKQVTVCTPIQDAAHAEQVAWLILEAAQSKKRLVEPQQHALSELPRSVPVVFGPAETRSIEHRVDELERRVRALESRPPVRELFVDSPVATGAGFSVHLGGAPKPRNPSNPFGVAYPNVCFGQPAVPENEGRRPAFSFQ